MATVHLTLPALHCGQLGVQQERKRFSLLRCGRRWGKSVYVETSISQSVLDGKQVGLFLPTYKLLAPSWRRLVRSLKPVTRDISKVERRIELITGGAIECWSTQDTDCGRGRSYDEVYIDEAGIIRDLGQIWNNAIRPTLTDRRGSAMITGTPRGRGFFNDLFMRGQGSHPNWRSFQLPTSNNPLIDPEEIADAKRDLPEHVFAQEYLGEPADDGANPFGLANLRACLGPMSSLPAVVYGIDLAKKHDWTVIVGLDMFGHVCFFERFQLPWHLTKARILAVIADLPTAIDATGVGDPIVEDLQRQRPHVEGCIFTSSVTSKQQWVEWLVGAVKAKSIVIPAGVLMQELESFIFEYKAGGRIRYTAPQGLFDDCVMALCLALKKFRSLSKPTSTEFYTGLDDNDEDRSNVHEQLAAAYAEELAEAEADRLAGWNDD
jgi:hypothetical protein